MSVTVDDVVDYVGGPGEVTRWTDDDGVTYPQIVDALATETVAQADWITWPTDSDGSQLTNAALEEALKRRVQRNLAMRALPLAISQGDADNTVRIGGTDPEIRRLESPYRKRGFA